MRWEWKDLSLVQDLRVFARRAHLVGDYAQHDHSFVEIALVAGGRVRHRSANGEQTLTRGDVLILRPGTWHAYQDGDLDYYDCFIAEELLRRELAWVREDPVLNHLLWSGPQAAARRGILHLHLDETGTAKCQSHLAALEELARTPGPSRGAGLLGHLLLFLSALAEASGGARAVTRPRPLHPAALQAIAMLEEDPTRDWSLTELSRRLGFAPAHVVRFFKAATGLPPLTYLVRFRLERAAGDLLRSDLPVAEVGARAGWPDANLFARRFRARYGMSASEYRRRYRPALA